MNTRGDAALMVFYHIFLQALVTLQVLFKVIMAFAIVRRHAICVLTFRVAYGMTNSCVVLFVSINTFADLWRHAVSVLAAGADWVTLKARNALIPVEALAFVGRDTLGVDALKVVVGEGASWLATSIDHLVIGFADTNIWRHARLVIATRRITPGQASKVIHCVVARIAPALLPNATSIDAGPLAGWYAFCANGQKSKATLNDGLVVFVMVRR